MVSDLRVYFEEIEEGMRFNTRNRLITQTDVEVFTSLTWATNPLFLSDEFAKSLGLRGRVVPGALTTSYVIGLLYQAGLFDHIVALTELNVRFLSGVSPGDMISVEGEVTSKKVLDEGRGEVTIRALCKNLTKGRDAADLTLKLLYLRKR